MAGIKKEQLEGLVKYLLQKQHFEPTFEKVFQRLLKGEGYSLIILEGPPVSGKSMFLKMVKVFQKGVPPYAKEFFPSSFLRLAAINVGHYQCVDMEDDCPIQSHPNKYRVPLAVGLPLSLASASRKRGLKKGHEIVVLCDRLEKFITYNKESNIAFLEEFAESNQKEITLLGAYTFGDQAEHLNTTNLSTYCSPLGYD